MSDEKILAIKFKYLGDIALMVPALKMLRQAKPSAQIHVLVPEETAPILRNLSWLDRIWTFPRTRGKIRLKASWPIIRQLRAEKFDAIIDFAGNDRGAIVSRLIGAPVRIAPVSKGGFVGRSRMYTHALEELEPTRHECVRDAYLLSPLGVPFVRELLALETIPDPAEATAAASLLPDSDSLLFHLSTSQPKKEWPLERWAEVADIMEADGHTVVFSSGPSEREQAYLAGLKVLRPRTKALERFKSLDLFVATLARARLFASPDTAPLHIAAGLGVPTLGLFGPSAASRWAPIGSRHRALQGAHCACNGRLDQCPEHPRCIDTISVEDVVTTLREMLDPEAPERSASQPVVAQG